MFQRPQHQPCHLVSSVLSCPTGIPWPLPMDQHLQGPDHGLLGPQGCQSQLIPALGGGTHCHHFLLPRQYLAPAPGLGHIHGPPGWTMPGAGPEPAGQLSTFLRDLWSNQGRVSRVRRGNWRARQTGLRAAENTHPPRDPALHRSSLWQVPPAPSSPPSFLQHKHTQEHSIPMMPPPPVLTLPVLAPASSRGSHDSDMWLGTLSIQFCRVVRCCVCSCESVHDHVCDRVWGECMYACEHMGIYVCLVTPKECVLGGSVSVPASISLCEPMRACLCKTTCARLHRELSECVHGCGSDILRCQRGGVSLCEKEPQPMSA